MSKPNRRCAPNRPCRLCRGERCLRFMDARGSGVLDARFDPGGAGDPDHVVARKGKDARCRSDREQGSSGRCGRIDHLRPPVRRGGARVARSASHAGLVVG